jgi:hypothetical protein
MSGASNFRVAIHLAFNTGNAAFGDRPRFV